MIMVVNKMIAKVKNIVTFFHSSTQANNELRKLQGDKYRKLKQDVFTRWNSTYTMLASYKDMHNDICTVLSQKGKSYMTLDENELQLLDSTIDVLGVFFDATEEMSSEKFTSISKIIPLIRQLKQKTEKSETTLAKKLQSQIDDYFCNVENTKLLTMTTILDPHFKNKVFSSDSTRRRVEEELREEMAAINLETVPDSSSEKRGDDETVKERKKKKTSLWDSFDQEIEEEKKAPLSKSATMLEYESYILLERITRKENALHWWKNHEAHLPRLSKLAKKYLCIPASSVPSERVFSKAGELVSTRRANLKPKNVDMILFLNKN